MISFPLKAPRWPQRVFRSVCVTATESQQTATCLMSAKAKDASEQRRWHFTERNTCTFSSTGSYSYITFPPHQSRCSCTRKRQCMVNLSLWIIHPFLKSQWTILFNYSILSVHTLNIYYPNQILLYRMAVWRQLNRASAALLTCFAAAWISTNFPQWMQSYYGAR